MLLPRKCSVGDCSSHYNTVKESIKVHSLPSNATECERWVKVLPNVLSKCPTMDVVACV